MAVVEELIRNEANGTLSFGNFLLNTKSKKADFEHDGDLYKVKTFKEITKLEKNGMFVYESVPGTAVNEFKQTGDVTEFKVEGFEDSQIILELEAEQEYNITINGEAKGTIKTNLGGKMTLSVSCDGDTVSEIVVKKA